MGKVKESDPTDASADTLGTLNRERGGLENVRTESGAAASTTF